MLKKSENESHLKECAEICDMDTLCVCFVRRTLRQGQHSVLKCVSCVSFWWGIYL